MIGSRFSLTVSLVAMMLVAARPTVARVTLRLVPSDLLAPDDLSTGDDSKAAPDAIRIVGARNGSFSGKLLATAAEPIENLKATPGDLVNVSAERNQAGRRTIPAAAVRIRYGAPWDGMRNWYQPPGLDILADTPPPGRAVVVIWVTVGVPKGTAAGDFAGTVTVRAKGAEPVAVPVRLHVADWTLPDPREYTTWLELVQSPDTLSLEYDVPLWSDKHWKMIEQSFALIGRAGSSVVYVPLICHTNLGNAESMVRWVPKDSGGWDHDFTILERYLDAAQKYMGPPRIVVFNVWDVYQRGKSLAKGFTHSPFPEANPDVHPAESAGHAVGPAVTALDAVGEPRVRELPPFSDPDGAALWEPLFAELHKRMARRGLEGAMALGMLTDAAPSREEMAVLAQLSGGLPWVSHAHFDPVQRSKDPPKLCYRTIHEYVVLTLNPAKGRTYGWKESELVAAHPRGSALGRLLPSAARCLLERQITGKQCGYGYAGADFWWVFRNQRGQRVGSVIDRYPKSYWRNLEIRMGLLAPGPDGPVASARYENVREGLQECEARIFLERALTDPDRRARLGDDLAVRAQALLDERQHALWREQGLTDEEILSVGSTVHWWRDLKFNPQQGRQAAGSEWFRTSGWQERSQRLFDLAAEAEKKLGGE